MELRRKAKLNHHGFTVTELLVAVLLSTIVITASYQFFIGVHQQSLSQEHLSEMQQTVRATLMELSKNLKTAGFKLPAGTPAYRIHGDSLLVFSNSTQPIDTVLYFTETITSVDADNLEDYPEGMLPKRLMKKTNSGSAVIFSDYISAVSYVAPDSANVQIAVTAVAPIADRTFRRDNGFRSVSDTAQVNVRNY